MFGPGGLNDRLLSQGCILEMAPTVGLVGRRHIPRTGEGAEEPLIALVQLEGQQTGSHVLLMTSSSSYMDQEFGKAFLPKKNLLLPEEGLKHRELYLITCDGT